MGDVRKGFMLVYMDGGSDIYTYGIPNKEDAPQAVYLNYAAAKQALETLANTYETFTPVLYGEAYPYESTTFEQLLSQKGSAIYGWVRIEDEDGEEAVRLGIGLLAVDAHLG